MNCDGVVKKIEDITWPCGDTKFIFESRNFVFPSDHVIFFSLYKILTIHNDVFGDFPTISDHFPKISTHSSKSVRRPDERFRTFSENFWRCPKIAKAKRRLLKTSEEDLKMFPSYTNRFRCRIGKKILSRMASSHVWIKMISSHVGISFLSICYHSVYQ